MGAVRRRPSPRACTGEERTELPSAASVDAVLAALERCGIWHFACHGHHDTDDPLGSRLFLAEDSITLRQIFIRPSVPRRLPVLPACQLAVADARQLDELVSFPSALLQAGIADVVCAHAIVSDHQAAMLLVLRFFDRLCEGIPPAWALADAQAWLRSPTSAEIHRALPSAYAAPHQGTAGHQPFAGPGLVGAARLLRRLTDPLERPRAQTI